MMLAYIKRKREIFILLALISYVILNMFEQNESIFKNILHVYIMLDDQRRLKSEKYICFEFVDFFIRITKNNCRFSPTNQCVTIHNSLSQPF